MDSIGLASGIFIVNCAATFALTGIIWLVQLVHYPSFRFTDPEKFSAAHDLHTRSIAPVVAPLMIAELLTAAALPFINVEGVPVTFFWAGLVLVAAVWCSTFFIQVPFHSRLAKGFDEAAIEGIVRTNWFRTVVWSLRSVIALVTLLMAFGARL